MLMPSVSAASGIPFVNQDFGDQRGVIYGIETEDGTPVFLDRFSWRSYAMVVMGITGSGKTYATKLDLLRMLLAVPDLRVIIVDPKQEYGSTVEAICGETYAITEDREYEFDDRIQCFQVLERGKLENIPLIVDLVEQIYSDVSRYPGKTLVIIDEAKLLMNDEEGRKVLEQFVLEARDTNTAISLLVQSAAHLTDWHEGRIILDNAHAKLFMRHERVSQSMIDFFRLSERKQQRLLKLRTGRSSKHGEGILEVSDQINAKVRFEATSLEHRLIEPSLRVRQKKKSKQRIRREAR